MPDASPSFDGLRVLALEARRADEIATLITRYGGQPTVAPAVREVPVESNDAAVTFAHTLVADGFDVVIFLTGVGARTLVAAGETAVPRDAIVDALAKTKIVARGPKPVAALREMGVSVWATVPEPNTWREVLAVLDSRQSELALAGARVAVQEHGVPSPELVDGLRARGAVVTAVPVYHWALPEDLEPLRAAVHALSESRVDVVLFLSGVQAAHLDQVARDMGLGDAVRRGLAHAVVASIGPSTSAELRRQGITVDLDASHPKMGQLVRDSAERAREILCDKEKLIPRAPERSEGGEAP
jgi:uroporphyrinogen-III synthase